MIRAFYFNKGNFGDILTPYLIRGVFNTSVTYSPVELCNFVGIGSVLERVNRCAPKDVTIWGTGFMYDKGMSQCSNLVVRDQTVLAVRGKLTASRVIGQKVKVVGDPGLLADKLVKPTGKRYKIGFIPHYVDRPSQLTRNIAAFPSVHCINIRQNPLMFLDEINKCSYVISSSLHGCIVADALGIPNAHILLSDKVFGNNYKFRDYYSAFDLDHKYVDFRTVPLRGLSTRRLLSTIDSCYVPKNIEKIQDDLSASLEDWIKKQDILH